MPVCIYMYRLVLLIVETLTLMLRESEIFACRTACLKSEGGAVVSQLITLLVRRPISDDRLSHSEQVRVHSAMPRRTTGPTPRILSGIFLELDCKTG